MTPKIPSYTSGADKEMFSQPHNLFSLLARAPPLSMANKAHRYFDKTLLSYASVMGIIQDTKLTTSQYAW
jgi:hypothetical protein